MSGMFKLARRGVPRRRRCDAVEVAAPVRAARPSRAGWLAALVLLAACSGGKRTYGSDGPEPADEDEPMKTRDAAAARPPPVDECDDDNAFCGTKDRPAPSCGNEAVDLTPAGVNVMIAVSGAASMMAHWTRIQGAVRGLRTAHPDARFGVQVFWGEIQEDVASGFNKANWCGATKNRVLDVGDNSERSLIDFLGNAPPGPSYLGGLYQTSPVVEPLNYYLSNASKLADPQRTNYLVFITDGNDNCFGSMFTSKLQKQNAYKKLAIELRKKNIRVIPVGFDQAAPVPMAGRPLPGTTKPNTDLEVLATLLEYGGSGLREVPSVEDANKLGEVIEKAGQTVRNCRFTIPATLDPSASLNPFALSFLVNGVEVKRDRKKTAGWDFIDGDTSQVEMFGDACAAIRAGKEVLAQKTCAESVCGTSAVKVETKPRAVLYLLDSSASRIACSDGSLTCLMVPDSPTRGDSRSFWEEVSLAAGDSLAQAINDDIDFGMQFFPHKTAGALSCEVVMAPEIAPAPATAITIMSQMFEKLPFGFSPVVAVLESVAANPGRLAYPNVQGTVVMLTDGGDNCSGVSQEQIVQRLGAAARRLRDAGVNTYVVRYGDASGSTPEQEAQLRAIVENGGTAVMDPSDPMKKPYVDARDKATLTSALSNISNSLATCSFGLGDLPNDADKNNVNLYLNGEVIPFDKRDAKQDGWGFLDAEKTQVQMYGASCEAFKTNRKTSVVVEFGCAPVFVQ